MAKRLGNQTPTFAHVRKYHHSDYKVVIDFFEEFGFSFMPWQEYQLELMMARKANGKVACKSVCFSVPRQNGKSHCARMYAIWEAMINGKKVVYSAHHGDTCREFWEEYMLPMFEDDERYPEFAEIVVKIDKQSGREKIIFNNGGSIRFSTRTNSKGRGVGGDLLILDEAQEFTSSMYAAIKPILSAGAAGDSQTIWIGTPPDPTARGDVWTGFHRKVHSNDPGDIWWVEWALTDEDRIDANTTSKERMELAWKYNPGMGGVLNTDDIKSEADEAPWDVYARERLGWWGNVTLVDKVFGKDEWEQTIVTAPPNLKNKNYVISYGIKLSPDDREIALCAAVRWLDENKQKHVYVELREVREKRGKQQLVDWLVARKQKTAFVMIDGRNGANTFMNDLIAQGFPKSAVKVATTEEAVQAAALLKDLNTEGLLSHCPSDALDESAVTAEKKNLTNGGYVFMDALEGGDSVPLSSAALAAYAAYTTKRNPNRKQKLIKH